jgi:hypothetical protein
LFLALHSFRKRFKVAFLLIVAGLVMEELKREGTLGGSGSGVVVCERN